MPRFVLLLVLVWLALCGAGNRAEARVSAGQKTASGVFANPPPGHVGENEPQANEAHRVDAAVYGKTASGRGNFLSPDPFGHSSDMSLYAFAHGDPVNRFDPDGRFGKYPTPDQYPDYEYNPFSWPGSFDNLINGEWFVHTYQYAEGAGYAVNIYTGEVEYSMGNARGMQNLLLGIEGTPAEAALLVHGALSLARAGFNYARGLVSGIDNAVDFGMRAPFESFTPLTPGQIRITGNSMNGAAFADVVHAQAAARNAATLREVSVSPYLDGGELASFRIRLDTVAIGDTAAAARSAQLIEAKSSATAPLTPRQTQGFPLFERNGGVVRGEAGGTLLPPGTQLPPSSITIVRPANAPN